MSLQGPTYSTLTLGEETFLPHGITPVPEDSLEEISTPLPPGITPVPEDSLEDLSTPLPPGVTPVPEDSLEQVSTPLPPGITPVPEGSLEEASIPSNPQTPSPRTSKRISKQSRLSTSSVSRVGVNFFDPAGVEELRRTLTERPNHDLRDVLNDSPIRDVPEHLESKEKIHAFSPASSAITLTGLKIEDGLNFEKTVRRIVRKYASRFCTSWGC